MAKFLYTVLDLAVLAALVAFIPSVIYFLRQQRKRADAAITLIYQYARKAQKNLDERINSYEELKEQIRKGNPNNEPEKDFTPLLFYTKEDELSFDQIREILPYLKSGKDNEQERLLAYFVDQSTVDAIVYEIKTDYFRTIPQVRKVRVIDLLKTETRKLRSTTDNLIEVLEQRKNRDGGRQ